VAGWWFSPGTPVSPTNKPDRHDITAIFLKVALNAITLTLVNNLVQIDNSKGLWYLFYCIPVTLRHPKCGMSYFALELM
jgi:hypothetical protein